MEVQVNGQTRTLAGACTVARLLEELNLAGQPCAVEINASVVPKREHGERALQEASMLDISAGRLERGRAIYITTCTRCHSPEPVAGYTLAEWRQTLPRMSERSNLTAQETADLRD